MGFTRVKDAGGRFTNDPTESMQNRFHSNYTRGGDSECWEWMGAKKSDFGYGAFKLGARNTKVEYSHRVAYSLAKGEIPKGMMVRHTCDNPKCVNPNHLVVGTAMDNAMDKVERDRQPKGVDCPNAKLTDLAVTQIRKLSDLRSVVVAKMFGVSRQTIADIRAKRTWAHVND